MQKAINSKFRLLHFNDRHSALIADFSKSASFALPLPYLTYSRTNDKTILIGLLGKPIVNEVLDIIPMSNVFEELWVSLWNDFIREHDQMFARFKDGFEPTASRVIHESDSIRTVWYIGSDNPIEENKREMQLVL